MRGEPWAPAVAAASQVCHACQAVARLDRASAYVRREDAWFCPCCWRRLPPEEIERVVREVALRGVPFS